MRRHVLSFVGVGLVFLASSCVSGNGTSLEHLPPPMTTYTVQNEVQPGSLDADKERKLFRSFADNFEDLHVVLFNQEGRQVNSASVHSYTADDWQQTAHWISVCTHGKTGMPFSIWHSELCDVNNVGVLSDMLYLGTPQQLYERLARELPKCRDREQERLLLALWYKYHVGLGYAFFDANGKEAKGNFTDGNVRTIHIFSPGDYSGKTFIAHQLVDPQVLRVIGFGHN